MKLSQYYLPTKKEIPHDAESISHQLMLRAGMIKPIASGIYNWLPIGLKVLHNVEKIVRKELNKIYAQEILMPSIHPAHLWEESGRWNTYGPTLLKIEDRNKRKYCYGPTHEEIITNLVKDEGLNYKKLPLILYQIQTKFRDELRPRHGIIRAREFLMKDAYSFHENMDSLEKTYELMLETYINIFKELGLKAQAVVADSGNIGGNNSHEFHIIADSGEDMICYSDKSNYAANVECAPAITEANQEISKFKQEPLAKVTTLNINNLEELIKAQNISKNQLIKTLVVKGHNEQNIILLLRGDYEFNLVKIEKLANIAKPLIILSEKNIASIFNINACFIGPLNSQLDIIADHSVRGMANFFCGSNENNVYYKNVNWNRDINYPCFFDIRNVVNGDLSPDGHGTLQIKKGIEVGHIFQLGDIYAKKMKLFITDKQGKSIIPLMGCYGLGISRIVAAAVEQNHDEKGIIWPVNMTPFHVIIIPIEPKNDTNFNSIINEIGETLRTNNIEFLLDDRDISLGVKFADADLIGIPHRIVISSKLLQNGQLEYKNRASNQIELISFDNFLKFIHDTLKL